MTGLADLWVHYQDGPTKRPQVVRLRDALRKSEAASYYALSLRAWETEAAADAKDGPAWYLPVWDFDGDGAASDAESFCVQQLELWGLRRARDYFCCVASQGRRKVGLRWYLPPHQDEDWRHVWRWWTTDIKRLYPTLDEAMAAVPLARWVGSAHRNKPGWHQVPLRPGSGERSAAQRPSPKQKRSWRPGLLDTIPPWARRIADDWQFHRIVTKTPRRRQNPSRWRTVDYVGELTQLGVPMVTKVLRGEVWARLKHCPCCSRMWKAAISPKGWLSCFSPHCAAHGGMPPASRNGGGAALRGLDPSKVATTHKRAVLIRGARRATNPLKLEVARDLIHTEVQQAFDRSSTTVLKTTPGSGKSTATIREIHRRVKARDGKRYMYLCPTRELAEEKVDEIKSLGNVNPLLLEGRHTGNCALISKVRAAALGGYDAGQAICPACPYQNGCDYYRQLRRARTAALVVSVWEHLHLVQAGRVNPHHIILDEFPERALLDEDYITVPALHSWMGANKLLASATDLLARVAMRADALVEGERHARSWRGDDLRRLILSTNRKAAKVFRDAVLPAVDAMHVGAGVLVGMDTSQIAQLPPLQVCKLVLTIDGELRSSGSRATSTSLVWTPKGTHYQRTQVVDLEIQNKLRLVLDGYGRQGIYERLLGCSIKVVEIDTEVIGRVWQIPVNTSRSAVTRNPDRAFDLGQRVLRSLRNMGHENVLYLTFQAYRQEVESWGVAVRHFGQGVGVNTYRHSHTAVVVLGTPRRPHRSLVSMACALHAGQAPIDERMAAHTNHLYADPRLQEVLEISREDEIAQGVHRIGPVIPGPMLKDIVLIGCVEVSELPIPILIRPGTLSLVDRIHSWAQRYGWWSNALRDLALPECLGRNGERAKRVYNDAVRVGVGQLPYRGPKWIEIDGARHGLGFVWGDTQAAQEWCSDFAQRSVTGISWTEEGVTDLSRKIGLMRA